MYLNGTGRRRRVAEVLVVVLAAVVDLVVWNGDRTLRGGGLLPLWVAPAGIVATSLLLLLRRDRPVAVWAVLWTFALAGLAVPRFQPFAGLLVALHAVASRRDRRTAWTVLGLSAIPFTIDTVNAAAASTRSPSALTALTFGVFWVVVTAAAWGFGRRSAVLAERAAADTARALREARLAMARDLHGSVANKINAMTMMAAGLRLGEHPERETLERIGAVGDRAIDELHRLLGLLRAADDPPVHARRPGLADLPALVADVEATNDLTVVLAVLGRTRDLEDTVDHVAHDVVAEALSNVVKYGGARAVIDVTVRWEPDALRVTVRDFSGGRPVSRPGARSSGHGLPGLRESVALAGGSLEATREEHGFVVSAVLPLAEREAVPAAVPPAAAPRLTIPVPRAT